jgi:hypothetical protein
MSDFGEEYTHVPLQCDSNSAIIVAKNPVLHSKTKHIEVRYHFFTSRDVVINDVTLTSLKTPEWSQLVFCDDFVMILFWSLWWRHICSSVTKLVFSS